MINLMSGVAIAALTAGSAMAQAELTTEEDVNTEVQQTLDEPMTEMTDNMPSFASVDEMTVDDILGSSAYDPQGDRIAEIDYVIEHEDGIALVLGIGGFLGLGEYTVALPLEEFELREDGRTFVLNSDKEALKDVPEFDETGVESLPGDIAIASLMTGETTDMQADANVAGTEVETDAETDMSAEVETEMDEAETEVADAANEVETELEQAGDEVADAASEAGDELEEAGDELAAAGSEAANEVEIELEEAGSELAEAGSDATNEVETELEDTEMTVEVETPDAETEMGEETDLASDTEVETEMGEETEMASDAEVETDMAEETDMASDTDVQTEGDGATLTTTAEIDPNEDAMEENAEAEAVADANTDTAINPEAQAEVMTFASIDEMTVGDVLGTMVYNPQEERIAEIDYVIAYEEGVAAVLGIGGFLGLGEYTVALPIDQFELGEDGRTFVLPTTKEELKTFPEFDESGVESLPDDLLISSAMSGDYEAMQTETEVDADAADLSADAELETDEELNTEMTAETDVETNDEMMDEERTFASIEDMTVEDVLGTSVYDPSDERIAEIDYVIEHEGEAAAVLGIGGFLGLGEYTVAVPLSEFDLREEGETFVLNMDKEALEQLPEFDEANAESLPDDTTIASIMDGSMQTGTGTEVEGAVQTDSSAAADTGNSDAEVEIDVEVDEGTEVDVNVDD
eukprot:TRINITY_DN8273_c0_g1_i1.p1 TRINITY_DN8273_c0_g1~~TRINITY_DN8273_c0_g1_i1.p1  ORF type:complete len:712 (+),score=258.90 TRINITY_DN8273_c0_g1_i1:54-2138(+)